VTTSTYPLWSLGSVVFFFKTNLYTNRAILMGTISFRILHQLIYIKFDFNRLFGAWHVLLKNILINFDLVKRVKGNQRDRNLKCELLFFLCPMFISFNSIGIYMLRVFSIFANMGGKEGGPKETNTNFWSVSCTSILMG
jgi:hypothetical protein